MHDTCAQWI